MNKVVARKEFGSKLPLCKRCHRFCLPNLGTLFAPKLILLRSLNMFFQWFCVTMVYYGLLFASTSLSGTVYIHIRTLRQYELWCFQAGGTKLERFLHKNQHTQRKSLKFEFWLNGELSKIGHHFSM